MRHFNANLAESYVGAVHGILKICTIGTRLSYLPVVTIVTWIIFQGSRTQIGTWAR